MRKENDIITRLAAAKPTGLTPTTDPHRRSRFITAALAAQAGPPSSDHRSSRELDDAFCPPDRKRTKARRRILAVTVASATAAATAIVAVAITRPPSAQAQVTSAAQRTFGQSFHVATTVQGDGDAPPVHGRGEFDPARHVGRISTDEFFGKIEERRYIGDLEYIKNPPPTNYMHLPPDKWHPGTRKPWTVGPGSPTHPRDLEAMFVNPLWALNQLQQATHVRDTGRVSGPGWTGHRYTFTNPGKIELFKRIRYVDVTQGAVEIDAQGRVRQVTVTLGSYTETDNRHLLPGWVRGTISFSDYGTPVTVTAPPADQVERVLGSDDGKPGPPIPATPHPEPTLTVHPTDTAHWPAPTTRPPTSPVPITPAPTP